MDVDSAFVQEFDGLRATSLTREMHERTCGYWYTITSGATPHTAFATFDEMDEWLAERGLVLASPLPRDAGQAATTDVVGRYRRSLDRDVARFEAIDPLLRTTVTDNGERTEAKITEGPDGIRTVHLVNVNYRS